MEFADGIVNFGHKRYKRLIFPQVILAAAPKRKTGETVAMKRKLLLWALSGILLLQLPVFTAGATVQIARATAPIAHTAPSISRTVPPIAQAAPQSTQSTYQGIKTTPQNIQAVPQTIQTIPQATKITTRESASLPKNYSCPLSSCQVVRAFSPGKHNWDAGHRGVDLAASFFMPVYAPQQGKVVYSGQLVNRKVLSISHPENIRTTYEPVLPLVQKGEEVQRGQLIAVVVGKHCGMSICLHWGAKTAPDNYLNPWLLLAKKRVRLL